MNLVSPGLRYVSDGRRLAFPDKATNGQVPGSATLGQAGHGRLQGWFLADGKLRTVAASGDPVQIICDTLRGGCGS